MSNQKAASGYLTASEIGNELDNIHLAIKYAVPGI